MPQLRVAVQPGAVPAPHHLPRAPLPSTVSPYAAVCPRTPLVPKTRPEPHCLRVHQGPQKTPSAGSVESTSLGQGVRNAGPACGFCGGFKRICDPFKWVYHLHTRGMPLQPHHDHWSELQKLIEKGEDRPRTDSNPITSFLPSDLIAMPQLRFAAAAGAPSAWSCRTARRRTSRPPSASRPAALDRVPLPPCAHPIPLEPTAISTNSIPSVLTPTPIN
jgi:hypothetical protein